MAELVDALASGASESNLVEVQVLFRPPIINGGLEPPKENEQCERGG